MILVVLAIIALVLLAGILLFVASRRRDADHAINEVSAETRRRDRDRVKANVGAAAEESGLTGRELEKTTAIEQRKGDLVAPGSDGDVEPWVAPDPEVIGVARRQFLNRAIIAVFGLNLGGFGLAVIAQLWPGASEGFGSVIRVGTIPDVVAEITANNGFLYRPEGRMWITEYPVGALEKAAPIYADTTALARDPGRREGHLPKVPSPRVSGPRVRKLSVLRVPMPRIVLQPCW